MGATNQEKEQNVEVLVAGLIVLPFTKVASKKAAEIYHVLRLNNRMIEFRDIFIAATSIVNNLPIVTLNKKHFERVAGLKII